MITFFDYHFPNMSSHRHQIECGFSVYRDVLVQWDEDHDVRVIEVVEEMLQNNVSGLQIVQEHEGAISFVWKDDIPEMYKNGHSISVPDGESWGIVSSISITKEGF